MTQAYSVARPERPKLHPAFTVRKLDGKRIDKVITFDAKGGKQVKEVEVDAGYMVYMRNGHSIRVRNDAELKRLGFDQTIPVQNDEGEVIYDMPNMVVQDEDA